MYGTPTSGGFLNDLLTPAVRFSPWVTPLLGPIAPMVSSDSGRGLTGIPVTRTTLASVISKSSRASSYNQSKLVFFIGHLLLFYVSAWEEKSHHPLEELVHQLDGERNHIHLVIERNIREIFNIITSTGVKGATCDIPHLKVLLHGDSSHWGAHFAEDTQSKLPS
uniref:Uncharacterized protein n=1 Tax=Acanthochromis polyacanthus TaxID=80966 RepID=A0A3Q1FWZ1_9TELE